MIIIEVTFITNNLLDTLQPTILHDKNNTNVIILLKL